MIKHVLVWLAILALLMPLSASAARFFSHETQVTVPANLSEDIFAASDTVRIDSDVAGDVFAAADEIAITGRISQDTFVAGNSITISGDIGDDIYAAGNRLYLAPPSVTDLFAIGNSLTIGPTIAAGDAYLAGSDIELSGTYRGNVRLMADTVTIRSGTIINGDLITYGQAEPVVEDNVTITGKRQHNIEQPATPQPRAIIASWVRNVVMWFVSALILLYLFPNLTASVVATTRQTPGRALGRGVLYTLISPLAFILLLVTVVGIPVAVLNVLFLISAAIVAAIYANILVGDYITRRWLRNDSTLAWQHILVGTVALSLIKLIPVIGFLVVLTITLVSLGSVLVVFWRLLKGTQGAPV